MLALGFQANIGREVAVRPRFSESPLAKRRCVGTVLFLGGGFIAVCPFNTRQE